MSKCFITKLPSSVDNDNLPVLGQLRIKWLKQDPLTDNDARYISLTTNDSITVKVSGAHFTDSSLTSNIGNTKTITADDGSVSLYISNDADAILNIDNKYSLKSLSFIKPHKDTLKRSVDFNIEDIRYCTNFMVIGCLNAQVSGDISALSNLTKVIDIRLSSTQVSGDISTLSNLTNINNLYLNNTQVSGDISALSNLTNINSINLNSTKVSGDISVLSNLTKAIYIDVSNTQLSGDITSIVNNINNMTQLKTLAIPRAVTITDEQKKILTDRGCTVIIG